MLTLPVIPVALVYALSGANPLVGSEIVPAIVAAVAIPAVLYLPSIPFGAGAFGLGDVKLLVGVGLLAGGSRALGSVIFALLLAGARHRHPAGDPPGQRAGRTSRSVRSSSSERCGRCSSVPERSGSDRDHRVRRRAEDTLGRLGGYHAPQPVSS